MMKLPVAAKKQSNLKSGWANKVIRHYTWHHFLCVIGENNLYEDQVAVNAAPFFFLFDWCMGNG